MHVRSVSALGEDASDAAVPVNMTPHPLKPHLLSGIFDGDRMPCEPWLPVRFWPAFWLLPSHRSLLLITAGRRQKWLHRAAFVCGCDAWLDVRRDRLAIGHDDMREKFVFERSDAALDSLQLGLDDQG